MDNQNNEENLNISSESIETAKQIAEHYESYGVESNITKDAESWQRISDYYDSELF